MRDFKMQTLLLNFALEKLKNATLQFERSLLTRTLRSDEERVEVRAGASSLATWFERAAETSWTPASLGSLAEQVGYTFWRVHHAEVGRQPLLKRLEVEQFAELSGAALARLFLPADQREERFFLLRARGQVEFSLTVRIFSRQEKLIAAAHCLWLLNAKASLPPPAS